MAQGLSGLSVRSQAREMGRVLGEAAVIVGERPTRGRDSQKSIVGWHSWLGLAGGGGWNLATGAPSVC